MEDKHDTRGKDKRMITKERRKAMKKMDTGERSNDRGK